MTLNNSSCDQGRFPVKLDIFLKKKLEIKSGKHASMQAQRIDLCSETKSDNDEFGITRVRVRYRVNFRSQKLRSS